MSVQYEPGTEGLADPTRHLQAALEAVAETARALKEERDEAREKIERQAERIRYLEGATNHATGTPLSVALRERDEAREALSAAKHYLTKERDDALSQIVQAECRAERFCQERDEARAVIRMLWERAETHLDLSDEEIERVDRSWGETAK